MTTLQRINRLAEGRAGCYELAGRAGDIGQLADREYQRLYKAGYEEVVGPSAGAEVDHVVQDLIAA